MEIVTGVPVVAEIVMENKTLLVFSAWEEKIREYAKENHIPIISDEGLLFLEQLVSLKRPKRILEIGTAIGYSAIRMHKICGSEVYTIERDNEMIQQAKKNLEDYPKIKLLEGDALEVFSALAQLKFDFIFIDAAKAQYLKFFELYSPLLSEYGVIVCDNMFFHGLVENTAEYDKQSKGVKGLIRKLNLFRQALLEKEEFLTNIYHIGDGMSVSVRK